MGFLEFLEAARNSAVIIGVGVGLTYMVRFFNEVVRQKDATIQRLQVENQWLKGITAGPIAKEYETMVEYAREMTQRKQKLESTLSEVQSSQQKEVRKAYLDGMDAGINEGFAAFALVVTQEEGVMTPAASGVLGKKAGEFIDLSRSIRRGEWPELKNIEEVKRTLLREDK